MSFGLRLLIEAVLVLALLGPFAWLVRCYGSQLRWTLTNPLQPVLSALAQRVLGRLPASLRAALLCAPAQALSAAVMDALWLTRPALSAAAWADRNPIFAAVQAALWLIVFGVVGRDFGIQDLFWHETLLTQILAGVSAGLLVYLVVCLSEFGRVGLNFQEVTARFHVALAVPAALAAAQAVVWIASEVWEGRVASAYANLGLTSGLLLAAGFAGVVDPKTASLFNRPSQVILSLAAPLALIVAMFVVPTAALWICMVLAGVALASLALRWNPLVRLVVVIATLAWVTYANNQRPWKLTYPGLERFTARGAQVKLVDPSPDRVMAAGDEAKNGVPQKNREKTSDEIALEAWLLQRRNGGDEPSSVKYKLVVVAASGGGITAAVWTALNLKRVEDVAPDFPRHVRLVTGASGGMLGAAGYVASISPTPSPDRQAELNALVVGLAGDSLTPVVSQMILSDVPSLFVPRDVAYDRGRELESVWVRNLPRGPDGVNLGSPFRCLRAGELEGWRPSLVFSPTLVEEGLPLLISNLDLDLGDHSRYQFFRLFPSSQLPLSTAVRMNAAFPFVSPAPNLPTVPPRRVVDAGYYDNYGIVTACAWLRKHRDWLVRNTSGVILLQIRAYPTTEDSPAGDSSAALGKAMQWLTTPLEGFTRVNRRAMIDRNNQFIQEIRTWFASHTPGFSFEEIILECPETVPLSWYMKPSDLDRLVSWTQFDDPFLHAILRGQIRPDGRAGIDEFQLRYYENLFKISSLLGGSLTRADVSGH